MEKLYKIQHNETVGWADIEEKHCTKLSKDQCKIRLEQLFAEGYNPNHIRVVYDE
jgi:uncharacterized membrane protein